LLEEKMLRTLDLEITSFCNEKCTHCYHPLDIEKKMLTDLDLLDRMLKEFAEMNFIYISLTGGEPLLHPKFKEIFKIAQKHRYIVSVKTNGTLINDDIATFFERSKPEMIDVSIYSADSQEHDAVTCVKGSFKSSVKGLKILKDHGVKCKIMTPVVKGVSKWKDVYSLARSLGVSWSSSANIFPSFDKRPAVEELVNLRKDHMEFLKFVQELEDQKREVVDNSCYKGCSAGLTKVSVDYDFNLKSCLAFANSIGKYSVGNGQELIIESRKKLEQLVEISECRECPYVKICSPCPAHLSVIGGKPQCDWRRKEYVKAYNDFFNSTSTNDPVLSSVLDVKDNQLVVASSSMLPVLKPGDRITVEAVDPDQIIPGMVIVYKKEGKKIVHRVISIRDEILITAGDNLRKYDEPVHVSKVMGKVIDMEIRDPLSYIMRFLRAIKRRIAKEA